VINARFATAAARLAGGAEGPLAARLAALEARQAALLAAVEARDGAGTRLAELAALAGAPAAFQETLGVTLAEFLAELERRAEAAPARVPQFS